MRSRHAFTLIELLVSLTLAGIASALMLSTLTRQQRFYAGAAHVLDSRAQLRDGADILVTDIRSASFPPFGLPAMLDSAFEFFTTIASSVVCVMPTAQSAGLPPLSLASGTSLTSMLALPDTGDIAMVYAHPPGNPDSAAWHALRVASLVPRPVTVACPASTGFTSPGDPVSGASGFVATFASSPPFPLRPGAPIQFLRRARYSLYRSSDNKWYLGHRRCSVPGPNACAAVQPVSGPYAAWSATAPGMAFRYYDADGFELGSTGNGETLARVDVVLRVAAAGSASPALSHRYRDSSLISASPRNRKR